MTIGEKIIQLRTAAGMSQDALADHLSVSRQSVSDCLQKCRKQLEKYEEKLGFARTVADMQAQIDALQGEKDS